MKQMVKAFEAQEKRNNKIAASEDVEAQPDNPGSHNTADQDLGSHNTVDHDL